MFFGLRPKNITTHLSPPQRNPEEPRLQVAASAKVGVQLVRDCPIYFGQSIHSGSFPLIQRSFRLNEWEGAYNPIQAVAEPAFLNGRNKTMTTQKVVRVALIAALYAVLTVALAPLSYGPIQFRISEVLKIFVLFDPWLALGIGIGTLFANLASPFVGPWELIWMPLTDMAGGLLAYAIFRALGRKWIALPLLAYALTTGAAVGLMLTVFQVGGFWILAGSVAISEIIIFLAGLPIIASIRSILKQRGLGRGLTTDDP